MQIQTLGTRGFPPAIDTPAPTLLELLDVVRRRRAAVLLMVAGALSMGIMVLLFKPPEYTSKLRMFITGRSQAATQPTGSADPGLDLVLLDSHVEVLKSEAIASAVVDKLNLGADPEFQAPGTLAAMLGALGWTNSAAPSRDPSIRAVTHLKRNLAVERLGRTYILEVSYRSRNSEKAGVIANAVASAFIEDQLKTISEASSHAAEWIHERVRELRYESLKADETVEKFKAENNISQSGARSIPEQQLTLAITRVAEAQVEVAAARGRLERAESLDISATERAFPPQASTLTPELARIYDQYKRAIAREAELLPVRAAEDQELRTVTAEIASYLQGAADELRNLREVLRRDYDLALSKLEALQAESDEVTRSSERARQAAINLRILESSAQAYRAAYDAFLRQVAEAGHSQSLPKTQARVITSAGPGDKSAPIAPLVLSASAFAGLLAGFAVALGREYLRQGLRLPREVERHLGIKPLGIVPVLDVRNQGVRPPETMRRISGDALERYVVKHPFSIFSDTLRAAHVALAGARISGQSGRIIGVLSAARGEGKSTIAANLAELLAMSGERTLLIDAHVRSPDLSERLTSKPRAGLFDVLAGKRSLDDVVWRDEITALEFLPTEGVAGASPKLLFPSALHDLLGALAQRYRFVVLDMPAMVRGAEAEALAGLVDGFVLTIEWGKTSPKLINEALDHSVLIRPKILGAILNKAELRALRSLDPALADPYPDQV